MLREELILKTKQKIDEINDQIKDLKLKMDLNTNNLVKEQSEKILKDLDEISQKIQEEYSKLSLPENKDKEKVSEMEKNIFNSIDSFNSAFEKAGSIFKTK